MRLKDLDNQSIRYHISEDLRHDPLYQQQWDRLDAEFFQPWKQYLRESQLTADQIQQIFAAAEKEAVASGTNSTMIGKIVEKMIPDSLLSKFSSALPEPDPKAEPDPQFEKKASTAVNQLPVDAETKGGLMKVVQAAVKNPQMQSVILSLVGGALGGILSQISPMIQTAFPGGGTVAVGITGAVVAGGVAIAAAKLQGKPWKEAFKGAIKPALAGAAGAVIGSLASQLASGAAGALMNKGGGAAPGQGGGDMEAGMAADQAKQNSLTNKYPPEEGFRYSGSGNAIEIYDADGVKVFRGDIPLKTMDAQTFADLANAGKTVQPQTNVGTGNQIGSGSAALDKFMPNYDKAQDMLTTQEKAAIAQDVAKQMGVPAQDVKFQGNTPVSVGGQPVPANIQQAYSDPTGMGAASDYKPVNTGSLRQGTAGDFAALGTYRVPGDPGSVPPEQAGQIKPVWRNKTRMPQTFDSREYHGQRLSEGQVYMVFNRVCGLNDRLLTEGWLVEGPMDWIKQKAKNLTSKVTADKLNSAWKKAGSPMDSEAVAKVLADAGVNPDVTKKVYADLKIPTDAAAGAEDPAAQGAIDIETVKQMMAKLPVDRKARLLTYLLGGKKAMNKPAAEPEDNPNIVKGTESVQRQGKKI